MTEREYPFSTSIKWYNKDGHDLMTIVRANDINEMEEHLAGVEALIVSREGNPLRTQQAAPVPQRASKPAPAPATNGSEQVGELTKPYTVDAFGDTFEVQTTKSGKRLAKVLCKAPTLAGVDPYDGNWQKYGVTVWPEILSTIGIDIDQLDFQQYSLPAAVERIKVLYNPKGGSDNQGAPDKVVGFGTVADADFGAEPVPVAEEEVPAL